MNHSRGNLGVSHREVTCHPPFERAGGIRTPNLLIRRAIPIVRYIQLSPFGQFRLGPVSNWSCSGFIQSTDSS